MFIIQLRLHPEMCIQICERGERIYACPLFYVTFVGNLGNAAVRGSDYEQLLFNQCILYNNNNNIIII